MKLVDVIIVKKFIVIDIIYFNYFWGINYDI